MHFGIKFLRDAADGRALSQFRPCRRLLPPARIPPSPSKTSSSGSENTSPVATRQRPQAWEDEPASILPQRKRLKDALWKLKARKEELQPFYEHYHATLNRVGTLQEAWVNYSAMRDSLPQADGDQILAICDHAMTHLNATHEGDLAAYLDRGVEEYAEYHAVLQELNVVTQEYFRTFQRRGSLLKKR